MPSVRVSTLAGRLRPRRGRDRSTSRPWKENGAVAGRRTMGGHHRGDRGAGDGGYMILMGDADTDNDADGYGPIDVVMASGR